MLNLLLRMRARGENYCLINQNARDVPINAHYSRGRTFRVEKDGLPEPRGLQDWRWRASRLVRKQQRPKRAAQEASVGDHRLDEGILKLYC